MSGHAVAQVPPVGGLIGTWEPGFNHQDGITVTTSASDPRVGFPAVTFFQGSVQGVTFPGAFPARFEAIHMSLIAKGPEQGKVLVWDRTPIIGTTPPGRTSPSGLFAFQAYSIVDPRPTVSPPDVRFRNFLLPIGSVQNPSPGVFQGGDLFCSGHCWSPFGDLVVVGGTDFIPQAGGLNQFAAGRTYVFAPTLTSADYAGQAGLWLQGPPLQLARYYPTAVLTGRLSPNRLNNNHAILVVGGDTIVGQPGPTWNNYEALEVFQPAAPAAPGIRTDVFTNAAGQTSVWDGPSTMASPLTDSLYFYPRCHLLTNGRIFVSGMTPFGASVDHETTAWNNLVGLAHYSPYPQLREYGASIRYPNVGGIKNLIARIGGGRQPPFALSTETTETCQADTSPSFWTGSYSMNRKRHVLDVVILPDAALLALGGVDFTSPSPAVLEPEVFMPGATSWILQPPATTARDYHSTAVLLPDGRVLVGGGDNLNIFDYEIFRPHYLSGATPATQPQVLSISASVFDPINRVFDLARGAVHSVQIGALPLGTSVDRAVLMAPGSTTHHSDMSQGYHLMTTSPVAPTQINFTTPAASALPAGIYMLFLVSNSGIPSVATFVRLQ